MQRITLTYLLLLLMASVSSAQVVKKGKVFQVTSHMGAAPATQALKIAEDAHALAMKILGKPKRKTTDLLNLHLFPNASGFEAAVTSLADGKTAGKLVSFASTSNQAAYVTQHPELSLKALEELGLTGSTLRRIAHESVRVFCFKTVPNHDTLPVWLIEGAASFIAQEVLLKAGRSTGLAEEPLTAPQLETVLRLSREGNRPAIGSILAGRLEKLKAVEQDALHAVAFQFLNSGSYKSRLARVIKKARGMKSSPSLTTKLARYAGTTLKVEKAETDFKKWLKGQKPLWNEVVPSMTASAEGHWASVAYPKLNAVAWRLQRPEKPAWTLSSSLTILDGRGQQLNLLIGRSEKGFASLAFEAGYGVTLFTFTAATNKWEEMVSREIADFPMGRKIDFQVKVDGANLTLSVAGEDLFSAPLAQTDLTGAWGFGAQAGTTGIWGKPSIN